MVANPECNWIRWSFQGDAMRHTILSVDHVAAVRGGRSEVLRTAGFEVIEAANGADALPLAKEEHPALVVLATELPGMDGFAVAKRLKSDPRTASIPVLHLSSRSEPSREYAESLKSGAEAYLPSPVEPAVLIAVATALIQAHSGAAGHEGAEEAIRSREEKLRLTLDAAGIGTFEHYMTTHESFWDRGAKAVWGLPPDAEIVYPELLERVHPEDRTRVREYLDKSAGTESQELAGLEYRVIWPNGEVHWIFGASRTFFEGEGEQRHAARMIGFHRDITESKLAEQALRASEEQLRLFVEHAPAAIAMFDQQMRYLAVSRRWMADYSLGEQDIIGRSHYEVFPEIGEGWKEVHRRCLAGAVETCDEDPFPRANGDLDWVRWEIHPWRQAKGDIGGIIIFSEQITDRKRAEEALRESEAILRSFFDSPGVMRGIVELIDGRVVHFSCNEAAAAMFGVGRASVSGTPALETGISEEVAQTWAELYEKSWRTGQSVSMEYARRDAGGRERWLLATAGYLGTGQSGSRRFAYTILDLTDRKRAEEALRESEQRFRALVTASWDAVYRMNPDWSEMRQLRGHDFIADTDTPSGTWLERYIHPDDQARVVAAIREAIREKKIFELEHRVRRVDGALGWTYSRAIPLQDANGEIVEWLGAASDITERKHAEEALRQSERMYRGIGESIDYGVWVCDPDGRNTYASESFLKLVGLTQEQCSRFGWGEVLHPDDAEQTVAAWKECVRTEGRWDMEHRFRGVDGKWHPILARGVPVRDERGRIACWAGINLDISGLKRIEDSLRASESRERARSAELEALMDAAPAAILVAHDPACRSVTGNHAAYDLLRMPAGSNLSTFPPDGENPPKFRVMKDGGEIPPAESPVRKAGSTGQAVRDYEFEIAFEDGTSASLLGDAVPLLDEQGHSRGAVGVFVDITGRKRAEANLREAQKLESLGLLAGGVAHDFNNLLVGVIGNASLAQELLPPDHAAAELLDGVIRTGQQAAHLTRQMLAYSGKGKFVVEALSLSALIPEMVGLVRPSISKKIALHLDLDDDLPPVEADRGQLQQVFMNLALNAAEAIGSHDGLITIKTGVQQVDDKYTRLHPEAAALTPGRYVCLEVRDTGCGMDDATKARIFDPFFSTKFTGRGLGLAAVAGILRGHKGAISVATAPGKGSCFTVLFPAAARAAEERPAAAGLAAAKGSGTILVVDDEKLVRDMVRRALERYGYTVLLADGGPSAIDLLKRHPSDIALVVLDLSMPRMSGEEALPELRRIRPEIKVLVSSGYSESETMTLFKGQRVSGFIQKPYTGAVLAEKVKICLG
jgi:PAS domain S-box-containing protein